MDSSESEPTSHVVAYLFFDYAGDSLHFISGDSVIRLELYNNSF